MSAPSDKPTEPGGVVERLAAAEVGSVDLDSMLFRHFGSQLPSAFGSVKVDLEWQDDGSALMPIGEMQVRFTPPAYTTSLDAALALAERVLPGCRCMVERFHDGLGWAMVQAKPDGGKTMCDGATPALALCLAILRTHPSDGESK